MIEITYEFYQDEYGGSAIVDADFKRVSLRAISIADSYLDCDLFDFIEDDYDESLVYRLKIALCASCDVVGGALKRGSSELSKEIASESVAGVWSKSFATSAKTASSQARDLVDAVYAILNDYLGTTPLVTRGYYVGL